MLSPQILKQFDDLLASIESINVDDKDSQYAVQKLVSQIELRAIRNRLQLIAGKDVKEDIQDAATSQRGLANLIMITYGVQRGFAKTLAAEYNIKES